MTKLSRQDENEHVEYSPTPIEQRILEIIFDPEHVSTTITEKCEALGIARNTYYHHMNKPEFQAYYIRLAKDLIKQNTAPLVNAAVKHAKAGSFQHFKFLMEMGDIHKEDNKLQLDAAIEHIVTFGRKDEDEDFELAAKNNRIIIDIDPEDPEDI